MWCISWLLWVIGRYSSLVTLRPYVVACAWVVVGYYYYYWLLLFEVVWSEICLLNMLLEPSSENTRWP